MKITIHPIALLTIPLAGIGFAIIVTHVGLPVAIGVLLIAVAAGTHAQ
jgi:hypothetical protein